MGRRTPAEIEADRRAYEESPAGKASRAYWDAQHAERKRAHDAEVNAYYNYVNTVAVGGVAAFCLWVAGIIAFSPDAKVPEKEAVAEPAAATLTHFKNPSVSTRPTLAP